MKLILCGFPAGFEYLGPRIRILVKNYVYSRLETSGNIKFGPDTSKNSFQHIIVKICSWGYTGRQKDRRADRLIGG